jgi:2-methylcitrate dehydratase PrpD
MTKLSDCLIDFVAAVLAGAHTPLGRSIARRYAREGTKGYAFALSYLAEISEFSHGHNWSAGHVGSTTLPVALAYAAVPGHDAHVSSADLTWAALAGYEAFSRVGSAMMPALEQWGSVQTGFVGALGAAVTAAVVHGLSADLICSALGIAAYLTPLSPIEGYLSGANSGETAVATQTGILAAELAALGVAGSSHLVDDLYRRIVGRAPAQAYAPVWPDGAPGIDHVYFKPFPCCRFTHGAIQAVLEALNGVTAARISALEVHVTPRAFQTCRQVPSRIPTGYLERQFSLPYITAMAVLSRKITPSEVLSPLPELDEAALGLARTRVRLKVRDELAQNGNICPTVLVVRLKDGTAVEHSVLRPWGCPDAPMTRSDLLRKLDQAAPAAMKQSEIDAWKDLAQGLAWRTLSDRLRQILLVEA